MGMRLVRRVAAVAALAISIQAISGGRSTTAVQAGPALRYWAFVDNPFPYPGRGRTVTVTGYFTADGQPAAGVRMGATWDDGRSRQYCAAFTSLDGTADCTRPLRRLLLGGVVQIKVDFTYQGKVYSTSTGVLPQ